LAHRERRNSDLRRFWNDAKTTVRAVDALHFFLGYLDLPCLSHVARALLGDIVGANLGGRRGKQVA